MRYWFYLMNTINKSDVRLNRKVTNSKAKNYAEAWKVIVDYSPNNIKSFLPSK